MGLYSEFEKERMRERENIKKTMDINSSGGPPRQTVTAVAVQRIFMLVLLAGDEDGS